MTPTAGRREDDATRMRITVRDFLIAVIGAATMWGIQIATQWRLQSGIDQLSIKITGYQDKQDAANTEFRRQIDEVRRAANMGIEKGSEAAVEAARLQGMLLGAGIIKGAPK